MKQRAAIVALIGLVGFAASEVDARPRARRSKRFEANKTFGLGLMVGAPTALSGKYFYAGDKAFDFGIGGMRYYRGRDGLHLHVDHLWHPVSLASTPAFELPLYLGIGARVFSFNDGAFNDALAIGLRAPIGIAFDLNRTPIDIFFEVALIADFVRNYDHDYQADFNGALGFRYYFD